MAITGTTKQFADATIKLRAGARSSEDAPYAERLEVYNAMIDKHPAPPADERTDVTDVIGAVKNDSAPYGVAKVVEEQDAQPALDEAKGGRLEPPCALVPDIVDPLRIVAKSPEMLQVVDLARRYAKVDSTVVITGESGSGKERFARLIHESSPRAAGPFIAVNCGAVTETLLESELFGHARGAFTGASHDRAGLFEAASGGTLFLDEVGEVSPGMQVKLLRALQEREIRRVGENESRSVDVRVVAATNRDLAQAAKDNSFRKDFYYRLKVLELRVPSLRERRPDILPLAQLLLASAALRMKRKLTDITPRAADQLVRYDWPGNVRELGNAMERAVALATGSCVDIEDLPEEVRQEVVPLPADAHRAVRPLEEIEKEYIIAALAQNGGNQTHTAQQLQIGAATLYRKLKAYGMIGSKRAAD